MICPRCEEEIKNNLDTCPKCGCLLEDRPKEAQLPNVEPSNNNMLSPKFLLVLVIALGFLVLVKNLFFKNVEKMPKLNTDYGLGLENPKEKSQ